MVKGETNKKDFENALKEREKVYLNRHVKNLRDGEKLFENIGNTIFIVGVSVFGAIGFMVGLIALALVGVALDIDLSFLIKLTNLVPLWISSFVVCWLMAWIIKYLRKKKEENLTEYGDK